MFQGTCRRRKELVPGPRTQPPHTCLRGVRHSMTTRIMAMDRGPGPSHL